jgi:hypothetical protein
MLGKQIYTAEISTRAELFEVKIATEKLKR